MPQLLKNRESFAGNSVSAVMADGKYIVYSYNTIILITDCVTDTVLEFNNRFYSVTTSKLQNMLIDVFNLNGASHKRK